MISFRLLGGQHQTNTWQAGYPLLGKTSYNGLSLSITTAWHNLKYPCSRHVFRLEFYPLSARNSRRNHWTATPQLTSAKRDSSQNLNPGNLCELYHRYLTYDEKTSANVYWQRKVLVCLNCQKLFWHLGPSVALS